MCLLCDDEKAYAAYMNYLDAMERQGKAADPDNHPWEVVVAPGIEVGEDRRIHLPD